MAFSFVQSKGAVGTPAVMAAVAATTASVTLAFNSQNTVHNMLVCCVCSWYGTPAGAPITSITDTAGNTWSTANRITEVSQFDSETRAELWFVPDCLAGANTVTINWGTLQPYATYWVAEYSGGAPAVLESFVTGSDTASRTSHTTPNTSATMAGDLLLGLYSDAAASASPAVSDGKTARATSDMAGSGGMTGIVSEVLSTTNAEQSCGFTTSSSKWGVYLVANWKSAPRTAPTVIMAASS